MSNSVKWSIGVVAVAAFALLTWWQSQPGDQLKKPETAAFAPAPTTETATPGATTEQKPAEETAKAEPEAVPAEFDVVRVERDGQAVIAGRAAPGQAVEIVLDGQVLETVVTDPSGQFATALLLPQTGEAQQLTLRTKVDGAVADSVEIAAKSAEQAAAGQGAGDDATKKAAADEAARAATEAQAEAERAATEAKAAERTAAEAERAATELAADAAAEAIARDIAAVQTAPGQAAQGSGAAGKPTFGADPAVVAAADAAADAIARDIAETGATVADRQSDLLAKSRAAEEEAARAAAEAEKRAAEAEAAAKEAAARKAEAEAAAQAAAGGDEPVVARDLVSAPVIILPGNDGSTAPVLVKPDAEGVTLLQPAEVGPASQITLDRISYSDAGALVASGRGRPGAVIRVYGNAEFLKQVECGTDGQWEVQIAPEVAATTQLLRFDAIDAQGNVVSRLETPFEYSPQSITQELKEREIVVQKGDYLWKFAEQYYGQGWRYSVIFSANSDLIRDPDLIYPGQVFKVPELVQSQ